MLQQRLTLLLVISLICCMSCTQQEPVIVHGNLVMRFNSNLHVNVSTRDTLGTPLMSSFSPADYLVTSSFTAKDFVLSKVATNSFNDSLRHGKEWIITGDYKDVLTKILIVRVSDSLPDLAVVRTLYVNRSSSALAIKKWVSQNYAIDRKRDVPRFWSFQGSSTSERKDWVQPVESEFFQKNYMGMNSTDYGGGIPVTDIWRPDQGIAIGHLDLKPKMVSLPVQMIKGDSVVHISIENEFEVPYQLQPGDTLKTLETFVLLHNGDYYQGLKKYSKALRRKGLKFAEPEDDAYESSWCAWGYGRDFTMNEIVGTLPMVKKLGIKWVTIDDGYQQALGDWRVNTSKFSGGDDQMKALVDKIHANGMKAMIWWAPLAMDPKSKLLEFNPDLRLLNADQSPRDITWWDAYYMSPGYNKTTTHTQRVLGLFIKTWGFDGLKMDGQHLNAAPADYNASHHFAHPEDAYEAVPGFFRMIYATSHALNRNVVIQNCPCGTCMSVYNMPYMNQAVASDPLSSWQVRHKGKTYKAIIGRTAYFGDHVELSDNRSDFASSFGVGAVLGTKFTWPRDNPKSTEANVLTKEKEAIWAKWFALYDQKLLSKGEYRGELYDIGYDIPETHVIQKSDTLHYAFYNADWNGLIELRGLTEARYKIRDYVNNVDYGFVNGPKGTVEVSFKNALLLEVYPAGEEKTNSKTNN